VNFLFLTGRVAWRFGFGFVTFRACFVFDRAGCLLVVFFLVSGSWRLSRECYSGIFKSQVKLVGVFVGYSRTKGSKKELTERHFSSGL
jgi:hypothetical protein